MSTIKSSAENLTLNADGANNDIIFQSNGSNVATLDQAGTLTATTFTGAATDATKLPLAGGTMTGNVSTRDITIADGSLVFDKPSVKGYRFLHHDAGNDLSIQQGDTDNANYVTKFNISTDGDVKVSTGDLIFGTAGKGICLGVTSNTDANTLDDYEEGTWTASLQGNGGSVGHTSQTCWYIKVGKVCHIGGTISWSSAGSNANTFTIIAGMPFASASSGVNGRSVGSVGAIQGFTNSEDLTLVNDPSTSSMYVIKRTGTTYSHSNVIDTSGNFYGFTMSYPCV